MIEKGRPNHRFKLIKKNQRIDYDSFLISMPTYVIRVYKIY